VAVYIAAPHTVAAVVVVGQVCMDRRYHTAGNTAVELWCKRRSLLLLFLSSIERPRWVVCVLTALKDLYERPMPLLPSARKRDQCL
jgi:hypothetical protein